MSSSLRPAEAAALIVAVPEEDRAIWATAFTPDYAWAN
jgi:hypothetical protein